MHLELPFLKNQLSPFSLLLMPFFFVQADFYYDTLRGYWAAQRVTFYSWIIYQMYDLWQ